MKNNSEPMKEIVTVAEMARMIGLSRSRFYSLLSEGIMPVPSRNEQTGRPFYSRSQQQECLQVRAQNKGINGKPILFYATAPRPQQVQKPKGQKLSGRKASPQQRDPLIEDLQHGLAQLGLADVSELAIRRALAETHPDGHGQVEPATLLMAVFRHLKRPNSPDNVA